MISSSSESGTQRVAVVFANLKGNIGDFAILQAMLNKIRSKMPKAHIDVYAHPLVEIDRERLTEFQKLNPSITFIEQFFSKKITGIQRSLMSTFLRKRTQQSLIDSFAADGQQAFEHFADYDSVFFAGGDQWSGRELGVSMFGALSAISKQTSNIQVFPFSLKTSIHKLYSHSSLRGYFGQLKSPIIARDSLTKGILDQLGVSAELGVDCVYALQNDAQIVQPAESREKSRVLLTVKGPMQEMSRTLDKLLRDGLNIELLSTCPTEDDRVFAELEKQFEIPYLRPMSWQEIVSEFKASSLIITNRLHGLILGSFAEKPLLPVTNRKKALAFVHDTGVPHSASNIDSISKELIDKTITDSSLVIEKTNRYRDSSHSTIHSPV